MGQAEEPGNEKHASEGSAASHDGAAEFRHRASSVSPARENENGHDGGNPKPEQSKAHEAALLELCPVTVWMADARGCTTYTNRHWQEYSGQRPEESHGETWLSRVHPEDQVRASQAWAQDAVPAPFEHELRLRRRDGQYRWHLAVGLPITDSSGKAIAWMGICVDIHDRKLAQEKVAEAEEHMRFTLEAAGVGSCGFYPCSEKKEWSGRSADMLGVPREQEPRLDIFMSRVHPEDKQRVWETVGALLQSPVTEEYDFDYRIMRPDGEVRWLLSRGKFFVPPAGSGEEPRMKGILLDITERKQAEEENKKLQEQLVHARKMEAVGRLASGVAHDFNNLITVIAGAADRLQKRFNDQPGALEVLNAIQQAADHASALTGQLLAFGRRQLLNPAVLSLNDTMMKLQGILRRLVGEDIRLDARLQDNLWNVKIDPVQLEQILLNLAANARDAMPQGGAITIETSNRTVEGENKGDPSAPNPGEYVCLSFSDTGLGMDAEVLGHLFEPFYTTKEFGRGTGLGLATVYGIVQQSGGHIAVRSIPGQGTEFTLYLPRSVERAQAEPPLHNVKAKDAVQHGSEHVLLVEDEPSLRAILAEHLRDHGYLVHEAANGREALELAGGKRIDLLITDFVMPGTGGVAVAQSLGASRPRLSTIFISGYSENAGLHQALQQPNTYYLQQPFRVSSLLAKMREAMSHRSGNGSGSQTE
jgi:two-component system, cell cycle sensor histidine kinase and response regulator CckA